MLRITPKNDAGLMSFTLAIEDMLALFKPDRFASKIKVLVGKRSGGRRS